MKNITHHQYRILCDHMDVYQFMLEIYERDWRNGVPAPFLEYALHSSWMDKRFTYLNRLWLSLQQDLQRFSLYRLYQEALQAL